MRRQLVTPRALEVAVVHRQVAVFPEMPDNMTQRLIRLEWEALAAVPAAVRLFSVRHVAPKWLDAAQSEVLLRNRKVGAEDIDNRL